MHGSRLCAWNPHTKVQGSNSPFVDLVRIHAGGVGLGGGQSTARDIPRRVTRALANHDAVVINKGIFPFHLI